MTAFLYQWEGDVSVHVLGGEVPSPNARASIVVHPDRPWTGELELRDGVPRPSSSWVFATEDGGIHAFRVIESDDRWVMIEAFNEMTAPPGRTIVRTAEGSVMIGVHDRWVDRALATVEVMNDDTWTAILRAEGSGVYQVAGQEVTLGSGDRFNLQADRPGALATVARVHDIHMALDRNDGVAVTLVVAGWQRSAPPL